MAKKLFSLFFTYFFFSSNVFATEAFCYRNMSGILNCEKTIEMIPGEYRAKAFFRDVPEQNIHNSNNNSNLPTIRSIEKESWSENLNSLPPAHTNNLSSKPNTTNTKFDDNTFSDNQPSSLLKKDLPINKNKNSKIQIFVAKWCAHCKALESFLLKEKIQFAKFDVEDDEYGKEIYESEGGGIPITKIGSNTIVGFEETKFQALLESYKPY